MGEISTWVSEQTVCPQYCEADTEENMFFCKKSTGKPEVPASSEREGWRVTNPFLGVEEQMVGLFLTDHKTEVQFQNEVWINI